MGRNRSLDEFRSGGTGVDDREEGRVGDSPGSVPDDAPDDDVPDDASGDGGSADSDGGSVDQSGGEVDPALEPVPPTYAWTPRGGECGDCGGTVERRWQDEDELVCGECKDW